MNHLETIHKSIAEKGRDVEVVANGRLLEDEDERSVKKFIIETEDGEKTIIIPDQGSAKHEALYGTFIISSNGDYRYELDASKKDVYQLFETKSLTEELRYELSDESTNDLRIKINGSNQQDDQELVVAEDSPKAFTGNLLTEIDDFELLTEVYSYDEDRVVSVEDDGEEFELETNYGSLFVKANGEYRFVVDNENSEIDALNMGEFKLLEFDLKGSNEHGTAYPFFTVKIFGKDDAAVFTGDINNKSITEDESPNLVTGSIIVSDVDDKDGLYIYDVNGDDTEVTAQKSEAIQGQYGTLVIWRTSEDNYDYEYRVNNALEEVQALNDGDKLLDQFEIESYSGDYTNLVITVNGDTDTNFDNASWTLTGDSSVAEGENSTYTVTLKQGLLVDSDSMTLDLNISGSGDHPASLDDYSLDISDLPSNVSYEDGVFTITGPFGDNDSFDFKVQTTDDDDKEFEESFDVTISNPMYGEDAAGELDIATVTTTIEDDENSSPVAKDDASYTNNAIDFDRSNSISVEHSDSLSPLGSNSEDYTISFNFNMDQQSSSWTSLLQKGDNQYDRGPSIFIRPNTRTLQISFDEESGRAQQSLISNKALTLDTWHNVTVVSKAGVVQLFIDGVQRGSLTLNRDVSNDGELRIGDTEWYDGIDGMIDNFVVYDKALTTSEIGQVVDGEDVASENQVLNLTFDDDSPLTDTSGNENSTTEVEEVNYVELEADKIEVVEAYRSEIDAMRLLANDYDPDGDDIEIIAVKSLTNGVVEFDKETGKIYFTAEVDGKATFEYTIMDEFGKVDTAVVTVDVLNNSVVAVDDNFTIGSNSSTVINVSDILGNDYDPEDNAFSLDLVGAADFGTAVLSEDRKTITVTPNENYIGPLSFGYVIEDEFGATDSAVVNIDVKEVDVSNATWSLSGTTSLNEGGTAKYTVNFDLGDGFLPDDESVTVKFNTKNGTARAGSDYTDSDQTLTIYGRDLDENGQYSTTIDVTTVRSDAIESNENFTAEISDVQLASDSEADAGTISNEEVTTTIVDTSLASFISRIMNARASWDGNGDNHITNPKISGVSGLPSGTILKLYVDGQNVATWTHNGSTGTYRKNGNYNMDNNDLVYATAQLPGQSTQNLGYGHRFVNSPSWNNHDVKMNSPIILDLDKDGVETTDYLTNGIHFDIDADGDKDQTGWVGRDDGLLVRDINHNGLIDDASELFGNETKKADGTKAFDGFDALREFDSNGDGVVDANDERFNELKIWKDSNSNGVTDEGELLSLEEAGIKALNTASTSSTEVENGNIMGLEGSYVDENGETQDMTDVWFSYIDNESITEVDYEGGVDLSELSKVKFVDMKNEVDNLLKIDFNEILDLTEESNELFISGDKTDVVKLDESVQWQHDVESKDGVAYHTYRSTNGDSSIKLFIEEKVDVEL